MKDHTPERSEAQCCEEDAISALQISIIVPQACKVCVVSLSEVLKLSPEVSTVQSILISSQMTCLIRARSPQTVNSSGARVDRSRIICIVVSDVMVGLWAEFTSVHEGLTSLFKRSSNNSALLEMVRGVKSQSFKIEAGMGESEPAHSSQT